MIVLRRSLIFTAVTATLIGCDLDGAREGGEAVVVRVEDGDGIRRVTNQGTPPRWHADELLRIGMVEGDDPAVFGQIRSLAADPEGNVYVADGQASEIRVFDRDGGYLRGIGRSGSGPGEFGNLMGIGWIGDLLVAIDPGNGRIQRFDRQGEPAGAWRGSSATGPVSVFRPRRVVDREIWTRDVRRGADGLETVFVRHTASGPSDTLSAPRPPPDRGTGGVVCRGESFITSFRFPSGPELVYDIGPGAVRVASWTDRYHLTFLHPSGDTIQTVAWSRDAVAIEDVAWQEETAEFREFREADPSARCDPPRPARPERRSTLRHIMTDDDGHLWVESATSDGFVWDVFDREGTWIAEVPLPPRQALVPPYVRDGVLYQVEADAMDVQSVAGYRISALEL
jgi:hypothetical protein